MGEGFPYADLVLLGAVAVFIALRLRSTLGRKMGFDGTKTPPGRFTPAIPGGMLGGAPKAPAVSEKEAEEEKKLLAGVRSGAAAATLGDIKARFEEFSLREFLDGARVAFEMVIEAFSKGDRETLKRLMAPGVLAQFAAELDAQQASGQKQEATLVSIESMDITEAELTGATALITLRFVTEQVHLVRGADRAVVSGDPSQLVRVEDHWTFERNLSSRDPNWQIAAT